jgi:GNAT superfamily N-acetyltransferase
MLLEVELDLRVCREEDLPALEWLGLFTGQRSIIAETFASQLRGEGLMLLAVANDFPLAQAWLDFSRRGTRRCPRVWAFRVFPPLRRAGLGTWMLGVIERLAKERGATRLEVGVERANSDARRLYERLGYRLSGTERELVAHRPGCSETIDQHLLSKEL